MRLGFSWIEYIERLDNMNTTIYEAVAKYKKDDTLPYTEYFSLGDFSTKDLAENAIMLAKQLPGFRAFCDENFYIEEFVLNDGVPRNYSVDDLIKNNEVFILCVNVNIRMYNFDDVQCTVIPSVAYGFVTGMNLQLC